MKVVIGLDIGTTSTKAVAFDRQGTVQGVHSAAYPIISEAPSWAEQDPVRIFEAVVECIREAVRKAGAAGSDVLAVSLSSAMHSLMALDENAAPLTRLIIWADNRSAEVAKRIAATGDGKAVYSRTGTPIHAMSPLPKLIWLRENRPDLFARTYKFISIKEYVLYRMFGRFVTDYSLASATGLLNLEKLDWDEEVLAYAGVKREQLSELKPTTHILQDMDAAIADRMGLPKAVPFVLGASDGVLANLGVGAIDPGEIAVTIGTSGAIRTVVDHPLTDDRQRTFCYALTERDWVIGGATNNGGIVLDWVRRLLYPGMDAQEDEASVDRLLNEAAKIAPGAGGLLFLPYLSGERAPIWNADARGMFFGLNLSHSSHHLVRAAMEGVMFSIRSVAEALSDISGVGNRVLASGGFARSPFLRQLLADVLGMEVAVPECAEASAFGAAFLGMIAVGEKRDIREIKPLLSIREVHRPGANDGLAYARLFPIYEQTYKQLKDSFEAIAAFQNNPGSD